MLNFIKKLLNIKGCFPFMHKWEYVAKDVEICKKCNKVKY